MTLKSSPRHTRISPKPSDGRWVAIYERAIGSKVNAHKYVGIKWGTAKNKSTPLEFNQFNWLAPGQYTKILGVPFCSSGENSTFWEALYLKIK
jgi:hypothetical protein